MAACSSGDAAAPVTAPVVDAGPPFVPGTLALEVPCPDAVADVYADPGALPAEKGAILKCARDGDMSAADIAASVPGYMGKPFTSGAHVYRILYRTERGDAASSPGTSSAIVFIPTVPRALPLPVVVVSHATRGQGPNCAASKLNELYQEGPLVGAGFAVIAPDLAGFANYGAPGNPPNIYAGAAEAGKSTLDGAKALRRMFSTSLSDQVALVGHSQGGFTALAALAQSNTYDAGGTIAGVFAFAPLWLAQTSWGALPLRAKNFPFKDARLTNSVAIWYVYSHGEAFDGPGHGLDPFRPEKRDAVKSFADSVCDDDTLAPLLAMGNDLSDVYDPSFTNSVGFAAATAGACSDDVCEKWIARFAADRPHLTGAAAKVPIMIAYGGMDEAIPADRMACVLERLDTDTASYSLCLEPGADHTGIVYARSEYAADWIAARTLGAAEPAACDAPFVRPACATPPPND
jgi:pimeloyl-ACP methyl ester carboxylesterase